MDLLGMLRKFGDRLGIIELMPASAPAGAPVKVHTRTVTLAELATKIHINDVRDLALHPAELTVPFENIFQAAGIHPTAAGWNVDRLQALLNSDPIRNLDKTRAQQEVLRILADEKVDAADLVRDVVARDQALDAYENFISRKREQRVRALEEQRRQLEREIQAEEQKWREWRKEKRRREKEMANAIGYLIDRPVISIDEESG